MPTVVAEYPVEIAEEFTRGFVPAYFGDIDLATKLATRASRGWPNKSVAIPAAPCRTS